jgi:tetratricopeptide (TPR) repeat protein
MRGNRQLAALTALLTAAVLAGGLLLLRPWDRDAPAYRTGMQGARNGNPPLLNAWQGAVNAGVRAETDPEVLVRAGLEHLARGERADAKRLFARAVTLGGEPGDGSGSFRPYFHVVARIRLAELAFDRGETAQAVAHAELARPLLEQPASLPREDARLLHAIYAAAGLWERALDWGEPTFDAVGSLDPASLERLAYAAEHHETWELLDRAGEVFLARDTAAGRTLGNFARGRALVALGRGEDARPFLRAAAAAGHGAATFHLGMVLQRAGDTEGARAAFERVAPESVYRPFALATLAAEGRLPDPAPLLRWFDEGSGLWPLPVAESPPTFRDAPARPLAVRYDASAKARPLLVLWQAAEPREPPVVRRAGSRFEAQVGRRVVALHWVENQALSPTAEPGGRGAQAIPGWTGTVLPWELTMDPRWARVTSEGTGAALEVANHDAEQFPRLYSTPVRITPGQGYLFVGRFRAPEALGCLGWHFLDDRFANIEAHHYYVETQPDWAWRACFATPQYQWGAVRLVAGVTTSLGTAEFADLLLCAIDPPELARQNGAQEVTP